MSLPLEHRFHHRHHGYRGGLISTHRALNRLEHDSRRWAANVALVVAGVAAWILVWPHVVTFWAATGRLWLEILGVPATVDVVARDAIFGLRPLVPRFAVPAGAPSAFQWSTGLGITAILLIVPIFLPDRARPIAYLLRLLATVQISSQIVFALFPTAFPYDVGGTTEVSMLANLFVIALIPVIMGFTFFPLAYGWTHRVAAMLWPMLHLTLAVPLLYVGHAWIVYHGSLLWMPLLFWAFGLMLSVFSIVAFYGWAVSWRAHVPVPRARRRRTRPTWAAVLVLLALGAGPAQADEHTESVQAGLDVGSYSDDLGSATAGFVAYTRERPWRDRWRVDLGVASRFDDTGVGIGGSYAFHLNRDRVVTVGLSTGTGDVILPAWRADVGIRETGLLGGRLLFDLGFTHIESKAENSTDGVGAGFLYRIGAGVSVGVDGRVDRGSPGSTTGHTLAGSLNYGIYRSFYANLRVETSKVAYLLVGPSDALVEFDATGVRGGVTWYVRPTRGVALQFDLLDTDFYEFRSLGLRVFTEW